MFVLNLTKIRTARERVEQVHPPEAFDSTDDDFRVVEPVLLAFDIYKDKQHFRLVGQVQTTLEMSCGRCLESFRWPVATDFDLRYQPHTLNAGEGEREIEEDDLTTAFYENDAIDLGHLMHEQFCLSLPMKPLCSPDCSGLCPSCGTNLNHSMCTCNTRWEDPRLAALKALKKES